MTSVTSKKFNVNIGSFHLIGLPKVLRTTTTSKTIHGYYEHLYNRRQQAVVRTFECYILGACSAQIRLGPHQFDAPSMGGMMQLLQGYEKKR